MRPAVTSVKVRWAVPRQPNWEPDKGLEGNGSIRRDDWVGDMAKKTYAAVVQMWLACLQVTDNQRQLRLMD
jgi:hypothetical protein